MNCPGIQNRALLHRETYLYLELVEGGWIMELPDGKVDMVLNLSVFPEEKTKQNRKDP